jgi:hypothetical protein
VDQFVADGVIISEAVRMVSRHLMVRHGLGRREQDVNGHPAAVGLQLAWDAEELDRWYAACQADSKGPTGRVWSRGTS